MFLLSPKRIARKKKIKKELGGVGLPPGVGSMAPIYIAYCCLRRPLYVLLSTLTVAKRDKKERKKRSVYAHVFLPAFAAIQ
jgi:hypothetical protein